MKEKRRLLTMKSGALEYWEEDIVYWDFETYHASNLKNIHRTTVLTGHFGSRLAVRSEREVTVSISELIPFAHILFL
jgi:hypothetical protein